MAKILQEFNTFAQKDLWTFWDQELRLRKQMRTNPEDVDGLRLSSSGDLAFLRRSFFFGFHRIKFWAALYSNRESLIAMEYLRQSGAPVIGEFFLYVAELIESSKILGRDLQFVINLYREDLVPEFRRLINNMDGGQCSYLESRTTNIGLRQLLQERRKKLSPQPYSARLADLQAHGKSSPGFPGTKLELISSAMEAVRNAQKCYQNAPWQPETLKALLYSAEMLFQSGLIADCLIILADLVSKDAKSVVDHILNPDGSFHKPVYQLLRKAIPTYCLLEESVNPRGHCLSLYRQHFPGFQPDPGSLVYLDIQSIISSSLQGFGQFGYLELLQKAALLRQYRPDDALASCLLSWEKSDGQNALEIMLQIVSERFATLPHEAYTVMGLIRWAHREEKICLGRSAATMLLNDYLRLFIWIPTEHFMNQALVREIASLADDALRRLVESLVPVMKENNGLPDKIACHHRKAHPDGIDCLPPEWLTLSKNLGVF